MQVRQHPVSRVTKSFFQLLQTVLCYGRESPSPINCPITNFAFRILEQIALKGGPGPGFYTPGSKNSTSSSSGTISGGNLERGGLAGCRSILLYQHFDVEMILHLVKVVPELFTSLGIITRLFDVSSSSGRKSVSRVLCLLRNIRTRLRTCGEGGLDVAAAAKNSITAAETIDLPRPVIQDKTEPANPTTSNVPPANKTATNVKPSNSTITTNISSGNNVFQQKNLNEQELFASLAKTAGSMLTNAIVRK